MRHDRHIARDISYSYSAQTRGGRAMIRTMENLTGRIRLIKRAEGYEREVAEGRDFWQVMVERYGLTLDVIGGSLANIPREGPLVLIANHPYGILDGLMMGHILSQTRPDFRILAHHVFRKAEDLNRIILPIDFDETEAALATNIETRQQAAEHLKQGGAVIIFPAGAISLAPNLVGDAYDKEWKTFAAKLATQPDTVTVPFLFDGQNSLLFQAARKISLTLAYSLMFREICKLMGTTVSLTMRPPVHANDLKALGNRKAITQCLRDRTYGII